MQTLLSVLSRDMTQIPILPPFKRAVVAHSGLTNMELQFGFCQSTQSKVHPASPIESVRVGCWTVSLFRRCMGRGPSSNPRSSVF